MAARGASGHPLEIHIVGRRLPGRRWCEREPIYVGLEGKGGSTDVVDLVAGDAPMAEWHIQVDVIADEKPEFDFRGPLVRGERGERFLKLTWGEVTGSGQYVMFRRANLHLSALTHEDIARALAGGSAVTGTLDLTDEQGGPVCASLWPPRISWTVDWDVAVAVPAL